MSSSSSWSSSISSSIPISFSLLPSTFSLPLADEADDDQQQEDIIEEFDNYFADFPSNFAESVAIGDGAWMLPSQAAVVNDILAPSFPVVPANNIGMMKVRKPCQDPNCLCQTYLRQNYRNQSAFIRRNINNGDGNCMVVTIPRVLKNDLRRQYPRMFANVLNGGDKGLLSSFLDRYGSRTIKQRKSFIGLCKNFAFQIQGASLIANYWGALMTLTPDNTFHIDDVKIKVPPMKDKRYYQRDRSEHHSYSDEFIRVECHITVHGTRLYNFPHELMIRDLISKYEAHQAKLKDEESNDNIKKRKLDCDSNSAGINGCQDQPKESSGEFSYDPMELCRNYFGVKINPPPTPFPIVIDGTFIVYIDKNRRIEMLESRG